MSEHPKPIKCLPHEQLDPVCLTSLDLKAYIECVSASYQIDDMMWDVHTALISSTSRILMYNSNSV